LGTTTEVNSIDPLRGFQSRQGSRDKRYGVGDLVDFRLKIQDRVQDFIYGDRSILSIYSDNVTTMANSGSYLVTPVALQLYSSTLVAHHLLRLWSCRYTSVKYHPWSNPSTVLTTPHRLPCLDVSSPCTHYILCLVSFSLDLVYFTWT